MDTKHFLRTLECELKARDGQRGALPADINPEVIAAALRRGQEYRALALQLALRQLIGSLARLLRYLTHPLQQRHKQPAVSPGS